MDTNKEYQTHLLLLAMLIPHFLQEEINHKKKLHQIPHESINHVQEPVRDLQTDAWIFSLSVVTLVRNLRLIATP